MPITFRISDFCDHAVRSVLFACSITVCLVQIANEGSLRAVECDVLDRQ
ncbi:MAG: hypothetical protein RL266_1959 [Bacteroidota bacterium]